MRSHSWRLLAALLALALFASACGDDATSAAAGDDAAATDDAAMADGDMDHGDMADGHDHDHGHGHGEALEVPDGMAVPTVAVTAEPDSTGGHNLFVELTDFEIAPERASTDPVDGEGHLHLYVDGERIMRFYNQALHISGLPAGEHELEVELSANNHAAYAIDGTPIRAATTVTVEEAGAHDHADAAVFEPDEVPTIELAITEDPKTGWNVHAEVDGFEFTPEAVGGDAVAGQGHLHLYVDGTKVARLYGPWWHLDLDPGTHDIRVEVVADDHAVYAVDGQPVEATATVEVAGEVDEAMAADADVEVMASVNDDGIDIESRRIDVVTGQVVRIVVDADVEDEVHVHGYDLLTEVGPDTPAEIVFTADSPGVFEVELEQSGRFLFELEVSEG